MEYQMGAKPSSAPYTGTAKEIPVSPNAPPYYSESHQGPLVGSSQAPWSTGLCDCGSDMSNCCITCWCPCITFGQIAEIVDKGSTSCLASGGLYTLLAMVTGCACFYSCFYRSKIRHEYMLQENPCGDCLVHCCCEACALCQEYRELKNRGFDMSLGWQGNVERQTRGVVAMGAVAPPVFQSGMTR